MGGLCRFLFHVPHPVLGADLSRGAGAHCRLCIPNPCWSWAVSSWEPTLLLGRRFLLQGAQGPGWGGALSWKCHCYKTGSLQDYSGLQKEPSVVWHFRCAAELQISLPSQECGCTALTKLGQKCFNKEEREESSGRKWKCSMSASESCVGIDSSVSQDREERELIATLTFKEALGSFCSLKFSLHSHTSTPFLSHLLTPPRDNPCASWLSLFLAQLSWNCHVPESQGQAITVLVWI